jgi:hypothetical protein
MEIQKWHLWLTMVGRYYAVSSASDLYKMPEETQNYVPRVMGYYKNGI